MWHVQHGACVCVYNLSPGNWWQRLPIAAIGDGIFMLHWAFSIDAKLDQARPPSDKGRFACKETLFYSYMGDFFSGPQQFFLIQCVNEIWPFFPVIDSFIFNLINRAGEISVLL